MSQPGLEALLPSANASTLLWYSAGMRILMPSIAIPLVVLLIYFFVPGLREQPWTALRIGGAVLALIAYGLVTTARIQLGDSFTVRPEAKELVTHGFYARVRNPMYIFLDFMALGLILAFRGYWFLVSLRWWLAFRFVSLEGKPGFYRKSLDKPTSNIENKLGSETTLRPRNVLFLASHFAKHRDNPNRRAVTTCNHLF